MGLAVFLDVMVFSFFFFFQKSIIILMLSVGVVSIKMSRAHVKETRKSFYVEGLVPS